MDSKTEEYFRREIAVAWEALQDTRPDSEMYRKRFVEYCRLLYEASMWNTEGRAPVPKEDGFRS